MLCTWRKEGKGRVVFWTIFECFSVNSRQVVRIFLTWDSNFGWVLYILCLFILNFFYDSVGLFFGPCLMFAREGGHEKKGQTRDCFSSFDKTIIHMICDNKTCSKFNTKRIFFMFWCCCLFLVEAVIVYTLEYNLAISVRELEH